MLCLTCTGDHIDHRAHTVLGIPADPRHWSVQYSGALHLALRAPTCTSAMFVTVTASAYAAESVSLDVQRLNKIAIFRPLAQFLLKHSALNSIIEVLRSIPSPHISATISDPFAERLQGALPSLTLVIFNALLPHIFRGTLRPTLSLVPFVFCSAPVPACMFMTL